MPRAWWAIVLLAATAVSGHPQDASPAYEVASMKLNTSGSGSSSTHGDKAQIVFTNETLKSLVMSAYSVQAIQVSGPDFLDSVHLDISAKYPPNLKNQDRPLMLRTLLEERLKLSVHREVKNAAGYALVVAKGGFKLKPVEPGGASTSSNGGLGRTLTAKKLSMPLLAERLSRYVGQMVVDKTGIAGVYDFQFRYKNDDQSQPDSDTEDAPSLFTALQETLGLRLQPEKIPVDMIVVDHVERVPPEN